MKKLGILLILIMFVICTVVGFKAAEIMYQASPTATQTPPAVRKDGQTQQTLYLLHVDQLKAPKPVLKSVWALFLFYSNPPGMTFVPLYQRGSGLGKLLPLRDFSLSPEGDVPEVFLQTLQKQFDLATTEYVVLDDRALEVFGQVFGGDSAAPLDERGTVTTMCDFLQTQAAVNGVDLPWNDVLPNHFRTNVRFDLFLANWIRLTASDHRPLCEIIPKD